MTPEADVLPGLDRPAARQPRPWARAGVRLALVSVLYATVVVTLLSRPVRPPAESPLVPENAAWTSHPVRLHEVPTTGEVHVHTLRLFTSRKDMPRLSEIRLFLATYKTRPHLLSARLLVAGTPCTYDTPPQATLEDNSLLSFFPAKGCSDASDRASGKLELAVRIKGPGEVALWTFLPPAADANPAWIAVSEPGTAVGGVRPVVRGTSFDTPPPTHLKRIDLLAYMWQLSQRPTWLWIVLIGSFGTALAGALIFPMLALPEAPGGVRASSALTGGFGAFCVATALAVAYAVLVPPLMAPDEPFHLLGFAALNGDAKVTSDTADWTKLTHLVRIRFHGNEHFRSEDIGKPWPVADPYLGATAVRVRSGTATAYWKVLGRLIANRSAEQTLLAMRLVNALVFGLAVGAATALGIALTSVAYPQLVCFPFFFVPTLPFFAMMASDYSVLCAAYVLLAASLCVLFLDGPLAHWVGLPLGLSAALMLGANRSSLPLIAVVAVALVVRILLGTRGVRRPLRNALVFWLGLGFGASVFALLSEKAFLAAMLAQLHFALPGLASGRFVRLLTHPGVPVAAAVVAALLETSLHGVRSWVAGRLRRLTTIVAAVAGGLVAAAVVASLLGSLVAHPPQVPMIQLPDAQAFVPSPPSRQAYVDDVVTTALTVFRLREPDLFLYTSFIGGFGWVDTVPPAPFLIGLAAATGIALAILAMHLALTKSLRGIVWLYALAAGGVAAAALYAVSCYAIPINLHGRYLIGWYLCWLAIAWSALACVGEVPGRLNRRLGSLRRIPRPALALTFCGLIHAYCLSFILERYF
ncbi:MAG: hypothetical protein EPN53_05985 [Acidobacteria bacterium]|nr:MAG: hypothetical protein EPN53_05985 [Acidobacteriota bacterium]